MYYSAEQAAFGGRQCIAAATSGGAHSTFSPEPTPIACNTDQGGATDPAGFLDADGAREYYAVYYSYYGGYTHSENFSVGLVEG